MALDPTALLYDGEYERIPGGDIERIKLGNEFVRVMTEAEFDRSASIRSYSRTADNPSPVLPGSGQFHQGEHAFGVKMWFQAQGLPVEPFSVEMSAALMVPNTVPDSLTGGEDGTASV